jgi:hypothetical protein
MQAAKGKVRAAREEVRAAKEEVRAAKEEEEVAVALRAAPLAAAKPMDPDCESPRVARALERPQALAAPTEMPTRGVAEVAYLSRAWPWRATESHDPPS